MPKKTRRKLRSSNVPTCLLCDKESLTLKIQSFCTCICEDSDYKPVDVIINGEIRRNVVIDKARLPFLKAKYFELVKPKNESIAKEAKLKEAKLKSKKAKASRDQKAKFYDSWEWKKIRYEVLNKYGAKCMMCGATKETTKICVDHIKPISLYWDLRLDFNNLQVLCDDCNKGKSNIDETDFRK